MLNGVQTSIVNYPNGPILIIAGAGTGKTKTITERIDKILSSKLCKPEEIFCTTFTKKAALELSERVSYKMQWCGTFHSLSCKILRSYIIEDSSLQIDRNFEIFDSYDQRKIIIKIIREQFEYDYSMVNSMAQECISYISKRKNNIEISEYNSTYENTWAEYQKQLINLNACDFDDLIIYAEKVIGLNKYLQNKFKFIFVDEYQDINHNQYQLLSALTKNCNNVCCVGDDDQSIYEWRGSKIEYIHKFKTDFPDAQVFKLEQSYRCSTNIIGAANNIIANNTKRFDKKLFSTRKYGDNIIVRKYPNCHEEASRIALAIKGYLTENKTVAVLCRTSLQIKKIYNACLQCGTPATITRGKDLLNRSDIRTLIGYLRMVNSIDSHIAIDTVIGSPKCGVGAKTVNKIEKQLKDGEQWNAIIASLKPKQASALHDRIETIKNWQNNISLDLILTIAGYCSIEITTEIIALNDVLNEYQNSINDFFEHLALDTVAVDEQGASAGKASIITIHESKGKEFDIVFAPAWEEGILPHIQSLHDIEEERRLAYVCITRAKENVFVSHATNRSYFGNGDVSYNKPSRFISELSGHNIHYDFNDNI